MGKKGSQRAALDKIIDDMLTEKAIKESGVKVNREVNRIVGRYCSEKWFNLWSILRCARLSRHFPNAFKQQISRQMLMAVCVTMLFKTA